MKIECTLASYSLPSVIFVAMQYNTNWNNTMTKAAVTEILSNKELSQGRNIAIILGASLFIAAMAQLEVPMFPVPITGQTLAVLLVGMILGPVRGAAAVVAYLLEGLAGLPVFAGFSSTSALFGPTAGYLLGFVPAAYLAGFIAEKSKHTILGLTVAGAVSTAVIFACGLAWLMPFVSSDVLAVGLLPFLPGAVLKMVAAAGIAYGVMRK